MSVMKDEMGQVAIDFMLGISLVLIAISFTIQFIPGLFMSESAGESSLDYTAYRTAAILTEDTGWWENNTMNGTDWEAHPDRLLLIGLASDDETRSRLTRSPNLISKEKTEQFMLIDEATFTEMLGLYNDIDDTHFPYGYNISVTMQDSFLVLNNTSISRGSVVPDDTESSKITRIILVEKGTIAVLTGDEINGNSSSVATVNATGPFEDNITIQFRDLNVTGTNPGLLNVTLDGNLLTASSDISIYRMEGWTCSPLNGSFEPEDVVCLEFDHKLFNISTQHRLDIEFTNVTFNNNGTSIINYNNQSTPAHRPARLTVEVW